MRRDLTAMFRRCLAWLARPRGFRTLLVAMTLLALVPIPAAIFIIQVNLRDTQHHRVVSNLRHVAELAGAALDADLAHWRADLRALALLGAASPDQLPHLVPGFHATHPDLLSLAVIGAGDRTIAHAGRPIAGALAARLREVAFAARGSDSDGIRWLPGMDGSAPQIGLGEAAAPATAAIALVLPRDTGAFSVADGSPSWRITVVARDGQVLAASDRALVGRTLTLPPSPPDAGGERAAPRVRIGGDDSYFAVHEASAGPWRIIASIPVAALDRSPWDDTQWAEIDWVILAGLLLLLPLTMSLLLGHHIGGQLTALAETARTLSPDRFPQPRRRSAIREVLVVQRALHTTAVLLRERKRTDERAQQMREALERVQRMESVGQVMAGVAHDFGNLIFVIGGNLERLRQRLAGRGSDGEPVRGSPDGELVVATLRLADEAKALVALLAEGGRQRETRPIDVRVSIRELDELLRDVVGGAARLSINSDADLWRCRLDPALLKSALCNLVINARKALDRPGEIRIGARNIVLDDAAAAARALLPGRHVVISVSDTGTGIAPAIRARIFEPFVTTEPAARGAGLGLSIVYGFVKSAGGHIEIASEPAAGTTVTMYFPAATSDTVSAIEARSAPRPA